MSPDQPVIALGGKVQDLAPDVSCLVEGQDPGLAPGPVNQLRDVEESGVDVDTVMRRRLDDRNVESLELFPVDETLQFPDSDLVGLVALGGHDDGRLLGLQDVVEDLSDELGLLFRHPVGDEADVEDAEEPVDDELAVRHQLLLVLAFYAWKNSKKTRS